MKSLSPHITRCAVSGICLTLLSGCLYDKDSEVDASAMPSPSDELRQTVEASNPNGLSAYILPESDDFEKIPQDPNNPLTAEKVRLGQFLFHETALATEGVNAEHSGTWSCASCHHADAGFKSGVPQGIGEGGEGFGVKGEMRVFAYGFDKSSEDPDYVPDVQPFASPTILNTAYQEVMLWNGQFGNAQDGSVNMGLAEHVLAPQGTPKYENLRQLSGLETQAIAGTAVHRLKTHEDSVLQTNDEYVLLFELAFPQASEDIVSEAGKAIAAYERTVLANRAPFQRWLRGDSAALTDLEISGAKLFFGKANCFSCHTGPGLSSEQGASEAEMFMALGFADFDPNHPQISGVVTDADSRGRGGFTGESEDDYKFKVPQLYNLADSEVFGHGASFDSIRDVVAYKNAAVPQKVIPANQLDPRFIPLGLTELEIDQLTAFLEYALYDPDLARYKPDALPTGACFPVADELSKLDLNC
ncbi:cytochrome-c peroxidase [Alteromonas oceani]|uniref:Cytochrome-c peroxidase n=1 Tax=Alteromonas oceani TaxID=2071609 RepID=A0ABV7K5D5_9ALTE|nr:cytochrome c peroxidase [Alteromonas oceani]